jgi:hypothetical protein
MITLNTTTGTVTLVNGSEGPRHDPYGYTELTVNKRGIEYELHSGLACWLKVAGVRMTVQDHVEADNLFEHLTGHHPADWIGFVEAAQRHRRSRCPKCGCRQTVERHGYPGEQFTCCAKCNTVMDCEFDQYEVM